MISFIAPIKANGLNFDFDNINSISEKQEENEEESYGAIIKSNIEKRTITILASSISFKNIFIYLHLTLSSVTSFNEILIPNSNIPSLIRKIKLLFHSSRR